MASVAARSSPHPAIPSTARAIEKKPSAPAPLSSPPPTSSPLPPSRAARQSNRPRSPRPTFRTLQTSHSHPNHPANRKAETTRKPSTPPRIISPRPTIPRIFPMQRNNGNPQQPILASKPRHALTATYRSNPTPRNRKLQEGRHRIRTPTIPQTAKPKQPESLRPLPVSSLHVLLSLAYFRCSATTETRNNPSSPRNLDTHSQPPTEATPPHETESYKKADQCIADAGP